MTVSSEQYVGKKTDRGYNMNLVSGKPFYPLDPRPEEIDIDDIAHALSYIGRFNGHLNVFYSVAQHSVFVSDILPVNNNLALEGLLHDAAEAYIGDMIRPLKASCPDWCAIDSHLDKVIRKKFGLPLKMRDKVKEADNIAVVTEKRDFLTDLGLVDWGNNLPDPHPEKLTPMSPEEAKEEFLLTFAILQQRKQ